MSKRGPEKVGTADIPRLAGEIAETLFITPGYLWDKRESHTGYAGKWSTQHGLGIESDKTLMVTLEGERDLQGHWRHSSRMEVKIVRGKDEVELKAVLRAPFFNEWDSYEVEGETSIDMGLLADTLAQAKALMEMSNRIGKEGAVRRTRNA